MSPPVAALFRPLSVEAFLGEWWGRRSLHLPGPPDKFAGFYTLDAFLRRVDGGWPAARVPVRAVFERGEVDDATRPSRYITPAEIRGAFAEGATICISQFDRVDADVAALCDEARAALGCPGEVHANAYWSPDGAGFAAHFDLRVATSLQIAGAKRWRFTTTPAIAWPTGNGEVVDGSIRYLDAPPRLHEPWEYAPVPALCWQEATLQAGDLLCLPAGALHAARAVGHSFALNLHFNPLPVGGWLGGLLDGRLGDAAGWRHVPPLFGGDAPPQGPNAAGRAFVRARLDEAIAQLTAWRDDLERFYEQVAASLAAPAAARPARASARWRASPRLLVLSAGPRRIVAIVGTTRIEVEGETAEVLRRALVEDGLTPATDEAEHVAALAEAGALTADDHGSS